MNKKQQQHDVAMTALIMGYNCFEKAYEKHLCGATDLYDLMGTWAIEFSEKYGHVDWEQVLEDPTNYGLDKRISGWEDAIIYWTEEKIQDFDKNPSYYLASIRRT